MLYIKLTVNKTVMRLFILAQCLLTPLYVASEPDISIQISFDSSSHNSPQQQEPIHVSAASERYLHNQSLQQAELNLHAFSAEQLAHFFACRGYTEQQILNKRTLYMNPAFLAFVRQYESYEEAVTNLHKELQQTSGFYKWLGRLNGYHKKGLTKQIATLYHQLEQDKQVRACTNEANDWYELYNIYQEHECGESAHLYKRCDVLEDMQNRGAISSDQVYTLSYNVIQMLCSHCHDPAVYVRAYGNQFQQVLHQECIELLTRTVDLPVGSVVYGHQEALVDCIDAAREYNQKGFTHNASIVADFCWALLDYGSAMVEGVACGLIDAVRDMVEHPIQTAACVIAGEYVLAYQLCKVVCNVADIGVTVLVNPSRAKEKWDDYIEPINKIINAIKNREMTCRDAIKAGTAVTVGLIVQSKLLDGLSKFYTITKNTVLVFAQNNPSFTPQQYMQTPEGLLLRATHEPTHIGTSNKGVSQASGFKQGAKKLLPKQPGMKGLIKKHQLPTKGRIRYVPPKDCHVSEDLPRVKLPNGKKGYIDKFGNVWVGGESRTKGQSFEWDVQLSQQGKRQLGWMTRDNSHLNVSLDGRVTHK